MTRRIFRASMTVALAVLLTAALLIGAEAFAGSAVTVQGVLLCLINAVMVALAANGVYDAASTGLQKAPARGYLHEEE